MPKPRRPRTGRAATTRRTPAKSRMRTAKKPPVSRVGTIRRIVRRSNQATTAARQLGLQ